MCEVSIEIILIKICFKTFTATQSEIEIENNKLLITRLMVGSARVSMNDVYAIQTRIFLGKLW